MKIFGVSDIGKKRKSNQDNFFYFKFSDEKCFAFVCDGMGGQNAGDVASGIVKELFSSEIVNKLENKKTNEEIKELIFEYYKIANEDIFNKNILNENFKGMGTTCITVVLNGLNLNVFSVGDSRAYLYSNSELIQLTVDHSYVQTLVDCGKITREEAKIHPRKNEITNAVGISKEIYVDFKNFVVGENDLILICSDGLTNNCSDDEIKNILSEEENVTDCVKKLIGVANFNGGGDNITAILIKI